MSQHEHCAALVQQFRTWWPRAGRVVYDEWGESLTVKYSDQHRVYVLQVPEPDVVVQWAQVVYNPERAEVVASFQPH